MDDRAVWQLVNNQDGSFGLRNMASGRYMDGDGSGEQWNVDESQELLDDDGWIISADNLQSQLNLAPTATFHAVERNSLRDQAFIEPDWYLYEDLR